MRSLRAWSLVLIAIAFAHPAFAWGPDGHRTIGTLAQKLISGSNAATQVQALLGNLSLADVAVWADCAKGVNPSTFQYEHPGRFPECRIFETPSGEAEMEDFVRRNSTNCPIKPGEEICHKQYHYTDVAIQHQTYLLGFEGTRDDDIVAAVIATTHVLKGDPAPAPFNIKDKAEALRLLVHYVGDIHQPLHVGAVYLDAKGNMINPDRDTFDPKTATRGGNNINVKSARANLHATWDAIPSTLTPSHVKAAWVSSARAIPPTTGSDLNWPKRWASESVAQANLALSSLAFGPLTGTHWTVVLPASYGTRMKSTKKVQLTRAGARLAQLLQDVWP
jgi:S1/P1 Nuclease